MTNFYELSIPGQVEAVSDFIIAKAFKQGGSLVDLTKDSCRYILRDFEYAVSDLVFTQVCLTLEVNYWR